MQGQPSAELLIFYCSRIFMRSKVETLGVALQVKALRDSGWKVWFEYIMPVFIYKCQLGLTQCGPSAQHRRDFASNEGCPLQGVRR